MPPPLPRGRLRPLRKAHRRTLSLSCVRRSSSYPPPGQLRYRPLNLCLPIRLLPLPQNPLPFLGSLLFACPPLLTPILGFLFPCPALARDLAPFQKVPWKERRPLGSSLDTRNESLENFLLTHPSIDQSSDLGKPSSCDEAWGGTTDLGLVSYSVKQSWERDRGEFARRIWRGLWGLFSSLFTWI